MIMIRNSTETLMFTHSTKNFSTDFPCVFKALSHYVVRLLHESPWKLSCACDFQLGKARSLVCCRHSVVFKFFCEFYSIPPHTIHLIFGLLNRIFLEREIFQINWISDMMTKANGKKWKRVLIICYESEACKGSRKRNNFGSNFFFIHK